MSTILKEGKVQTLEFRDEFHFLSLDYLSPLKIFDHEFRTARDAISFFASVSCSQRDRLKEGTFRYDEPLLIRSDWAGLEEAVKAAVLSAKFSQSPKLAARLLGTGTLYLTDPACPAEGLIMTRMRDVALRALERSDTKDIAIALKAIRASGLEPFKKKHLKGTVNHHLRVEYVVSGEALTNPALIESLGGQKIGRRVFFPGSIYSMSKEVSDRKSFASKVREALERFSELTERKVTTRGLSPFLQFASKSIFSECGERYKEHNFQERPRSEEEVEEVETAGSRA